MPVRACLPVRACVCVPVRACAKLGSDCGSGAALFRIHTDGRRNEHLQILDQTVYMRSATVDKAEYIGLLARVKTFADAVQGKELLRSFRRAAEALHDALADPMDVILPALHAAVSLSETAGIRDQHHQPETSTRCLSCSMEHSGSGGCSS